MIRGFGRARHVWLVGMPGAGKSTAGKGLAERLGLAFVDLDREIERAAGRSVEEIFAQDGEEEFRALESRTLATVAGGPESVVATGGGAVLSGENRRVMRRTGLVLHLAVDSVEAERRLAADPAPRPLLAEPGAWERLAGDRGQAYEEAADVTIRSDTGSTFEGGATLEDSIVAISVPSVSVRVEAGSPGYDVLVGPGVLGWLRLFVPEPPPGGTAFVVADQRVAEEFLAIVAGALEEAGWRSVHLPVPEGEQAKTLDVAEALYGQLAVREAQRDDLVVGLGGGSTGDLAGFVAATYLRGMRLVLVPTTLLAQVDAAIGGKTAVNLPAGKNLVGAFHQPVLVVADVMALTTLPEREFRSGLGEVAKYALVFDRGLPKLLEREAGRVLRPDAEVEVEVEVEGSLDVLQDLVRGCVEIKAEIVSRDERDADERLFLNYGHTLGHALERLSGFQGRSHGEAVAIGMVFAARLAERLDVATRGLVDRHVRLLKPLGLATGGPLPAPEDVLAVMRMDKKRRGALRFVLLEDVGRPTVVTDVPDDVVLETLEAM
ncbi:MAG: 3-dehydroquinate synthase [Actinomycetota bacterium]